MARFMIPAVVEFVSEFPRTPTGKIAKSQLRPAT
jgi:acyl-coenzyme A synthetase/AMP-(fatty) acid ligase